MQMKNKWKKRRSLNNKAEQMCLCFNILHINFVTIALFFAFRFILSLFAFRFCILQFLCCRILGCCLVGCFSTLWGFECRLCFVRCRRVFSSCLFILSDGSMGLWIVDAFRWAFFSSSSSAFCFVFVKCFVDVCTKACDRFYVWLRRWV